MVDKKYEVSILSVNLDENSVTIKFKGGSEKTFEVVSPAKIEYAKEGNAEVSVKNDEITYLRMKSGGFQKREYPQRETSNRSDSVPETSPLVQRLIVRQHTQKVASEIVKGYVDKKEVVLAFAEYLKQIVDTAHILEEDVFRDNE